MTDSDDRRHTIARWIIQGPFDLRLTTTAVAISFALITWRTWPSAYAAVAAGIALIYAVIAGVAIATGKSDLYEPGTTE